MIDELNQAITDYQTKWQAFVAERKDQGYFTKLKPTAVAWKTEDLADFETRFAELRDKCDLVVLKWLNERWVAKMHLKDSKLEGDVTIIKLMQRRPNSTDATGLDHLDFYNPDVPAEDMLNAEGIKWSHEENGNCKWISVWFAGTEAKLRTETVIDVTVEDMQEINKKVIG